MRIRLKQILDQQGKTRNWLSVQTGISYNAIHQLYEERTTKVEFDTIEKICKALQCTPNDIFELEDN
jgi:putative transcriptional regulator